MAGLHTGEDVLTPGEMGMWLSKLGGVPSDFDKSCTWSLLARVSSCSKEGALYR